MSDEWVIINGHVLGHCDYLRSLDDLDGGHEQCDCSDLFEDDDGFWDEDEELVL